MHRFQDLASSAFEHLLYFISGGSFSVLANHVISETSGLSGEVPQGYVLGPIDFFLNIFPLGQIILSMLPPV